MAAPNKPSGPAKQTTSGKPTNAPAQPQRGSSPAKPGQKNK